MNHSYYPPDQAMSFARALSIYNCFHEKHPTAHDYTLNLYNITYKSVVDWIATKSGQKHWERFKKCVKYIECQYASTEAYFHYSSVKVNALFRRILTKEFLDRLPYDLDNISRIQLEFDGGS